MPVRYLVCLLTASLFLSSCELTTIEPVPEQNTTAYLGSWENFFGDGWEFTESSYLQSMAWNNTITYQEKGSLRALGNRLTISKEFYRNSIDEEWLAADFSSQFTRDTEEYSNYLVENNFDPITEDEYWNINFQWAEDYEGEGSIGNPYPGYVEGMA